MHKGGAIISAMRAPIIKHTHTHTHTHLNRLGWAFTGDKVVGPHLLDNSILSDRCAIKALKPDADRVQTLSV